VGIVIGIGGVSRAGKSTLAGKIASWLPNKKVSILEMDDFVFPEQQIPKIKNETDWEVPESVDYTRLAKSIAEEKNSSDIVIIEGIMIFNDPKILALYDRKIFIEIDYDSFILRKRKDKRWEIPDWYFEHIWTSYIVHGRVNVDDALKLNGIGGFDRDQIMDFLAIPVS
jgi:uridine kinase